MKKANDFEIEKVQFQGVPSLLLNLLPVSVLCCLTVAYKKECSSCCRVLLNYNAYKNKESKKQPFNEKGRNLLVPSLQYCQFGHDDRKNRIFSAR